jgi:ubiquinone/menaquinone biosynthesis C-methylase UbiE
MQMRVVRRWLGDRFPILRAIKRRLAPGSPAASPADADRVSACWADTANRRRQVSQMGWLDSPLVQRYYVEPAQRNDGRLGSWLPNVVAQFPPCRGGHWLSLGCGAAGEEIAAAQLGLFHSMDACDISAGSLEIARRAAQQMQVTAISFRLADFNELTLPPGRHDVATMSMSLHHVANLEGLLEQVARSLKPGGWFLVNEYVGPSQMQFGDCEMCIVEDLLAILPDRLRYDYLNRQIKTRYVVRSRAWWNQADPSESIRSDQIEGLLGQYFHVVARKPYGGTLLHPLLEGIVGNFSPDRPDDVAILRLLAYVEKSLIEAGVLKDHFCVFVMRTRSEASSS